LSHAPWPILEKNEDTAHLAKEGIFILPTVSGDADNRLRAVRRSVLIWGRWVGCDRFRSCGLKPSPGTFTPKPTAWGPASSPDPRSFPVTYLSLGRGRRPGLGRPRLA